MEGFRGKLLINAIIMAGSALVFWYGPTLVFGGKPTGFQLVLFGIGMVALISALEHFGDSGQPAPSSVTPPNPDLVYFKCAHCAVDLNSAKANAGSKAPCPNCKKEVTVPPELVKTA